MKPIVISVVILIITILSIFGLLAFAEWSINPSLWDVGTRIYGSLFFAFAFSAWIGFLINFIIDKHGR